MLWGKFTREKGQSDIVGSLSVANCAIAGVRFVALACVEQGAPDYRIEDEAHEKIGSGWKMASHEGPYISVMLKTPRLNAGDALYPILVESEVDQFELVWEVGEARPPGGKPKPKRAHLRVVP